MNSINLANTEQRRTAVHRGTAGPAAGSRDPSRQTVPVIAVAPEEEAADALTLGRRVRERRTQLGLKLEQLAAAIERAPYQVSAIENGK